MKNPYLGEPQAAEIMVKATVENTVVSDRELEVIGAEAEEALSMLYDTSGVAVVGGDGRTSHRDYTPEEIADMVVIAAAYRRALDILTALQRGEVKLVLVTNS